MLPDYKYGRAGREWILSFRTNGHRPCSGEDKNSKYICFFAHLIVSLPSKTIIYNQYEETFIIHIIAGPSVAGQCI